MDVVHDMRSWGGDQEGYSCWSSVTCSLAYTQCVAAAAATCACLEGCSGQLASSRWQGMARDVIAVRLQGGVICLVCTPLMIYCQFEAVSARQAVHSVVRCWQQLQGAKARSICMCSPAVNPCGIASWLSSELSGGAQLHNNSDVDGLPM
jgi:hypothetical protein